MKVSPVHNDYTLMSYNAVLMASKNDNIQLIYIS